MRFLHLGDLHLGKSLGDFDLIGDQKYILDQILAVIREKTVDAVLIAGDVYDKAIPSEAATNLLDYFLCRLAETGVKTFLISGNHDSDDRLNYGSRLFQDNQIFISSVFRGELEKYTVEDEQGEVDVYLLPFVKASQVRHYFPDAKIDSYDDAVRVIIEHAHLDRHKRNVIVAHQFVAGASRCESEDIQIGGLDNIDASVFEAFDYTALGHIHSPQNVGKGMVRYCGTPLKYSFSETDQEKSITVVEMEEKGTVKIRLLPLKPFRDMRKLRGTYMELTARSFYRDMNCEDCIQVTLTDEDDVPDGLQKLRVIYPNIMQLLYDNQRTRASSQIDAVQDVEEKTELELFREFYELQNNQPMMKQQEEFAEKLIREIKE